MVDIKVNDNITAQQAINRDITLVKRQFKQFGEINANMNRIQNEMRLVNNAMDNLDRTQQTVADNLRLGLERAEQ